MPIRRPCINCGALTTRTTRCETCQRLHDSLYDSDYRVAAAIIRANATVCHICGKGQIDDDPFTADHVIAGNRLSPLAAAHRSCNIRKGNRI